MVADIEEKIAVVMQEAVEKRAELLEITYGQAPDSYKKRILNHLNKKEVRKFYHRLEKTDKGWGRIYLHFK